jgi:hypothetical protein
MKVVIIKNIGGRAVGYRLIRELNDDPEILETLRALHYWGKREGNVKGGIEYAGRVSQKGTDDTVELTFLRKDENKKRSDEARDNIIKNY